MSSNLKNLRDHHLQLLKDELKAIDYIGLTFDFWSNRRSVSFLCITGHWFNDKIEYFSKVIYFSSFKEQHSGFNIAISIKEKLVDLGIYRKVVAITCDGGGNLISACNQLDGSIKRIWCCTHRLHLVVINGLGFWNKDTKFDNNKVNYSATQATTRNSALHNVISNTREESMDTSWSSESEAGEVFTLLVLHLTIGFEVLTATS